jgi:type VI secretion system secreted protein Hcp
MSGRVYLKLSLVQGGAAIEGESTVESIGGVDVSKFIECDGFTESVTTAQDAASRTPTGQRLYEPLLIRKWVDKSSPELAKALCETAKVEGEFYFFRPSLENAQMEHFFTVKIEEARVSSIKRFLPEGSDDVARAGKPPLENVSFVFSKITWTHVPGNKVHTDNWRQQSAGS